MSPTQHHPPCLTLNDLLQQYMSQPKLYLFGVFFVLIGVMGTLLNIVPVYIVCRTQRQVKQNPSSRIAFLMSLSDLFRSGAGHMIFGLDLMLNLQSSISDTVCWKHRVWTVPLQLFSLSSAYLNCLIILDRFFRIMYIQSYTAFMTRTKFTVITLLCLFLVCLQFTLVVVGDVFVSGRNGRGSLGGMMVTFPINLGLFVTCIALHMKSIRMLQEHQKTICLTLGSQKILKLATIYLITFAAFYAPLLTANLMVFFQEQLTLTDETLAYAVVMTFAVSAFSSPVNAVAFAVKNLKAQNTIRTQCNRFRKSKRTLKTNNKVGVA